MLIRMVHVRMQCTAPGSSMKVFAVQLHLLTLLLALQLSCLDRAMPATTSLFASVCPSGIRCHGCRQGQAGVVAPPSSALDSSGVAVIWL